MKLAFTTLGCPDWDMDRIIEVAVESGYRGVDFRGYLREMDIYKLPEFSTEIEATKKKFNDASLEIPCFSSSVKLFTESDAQLADGLEELEAYGSLCEQFNTPYIRVFGGKIGETPRNEALDKVDRNIAEMVKVAEKYQVTLLLETHDDWTNCDYVDAVLERIDSPRLKVLWDVHHPYRTAGENPEQTWETLGDEIEYTHWKDSFLKADTERGYQLCLLGEGDIPLERMCRLLLENGYNGYFTLEWEKFWCPEIEEPETAFAQYAKFMKKISNKIRG